MLRFIVSTVITIAIVIVALRLIGINIDFAGFVQQGIAEIKTLFAAFKASI